MWQCLAQIVPFVTQQHLSLLSPIDLSIDCDIHIKQPWNVRKQSMVLNVFHNLNNPTCTPEINHSPEQTLLNQASGKGPKPSQSEYWSTGMDLSDWSLSCLNINLLGNFWVDFVPIFSTPWDLFHASWNTSKSWMEMSLTSQLSTILTHARQLQPGLTASKLPTPNPLHCAR